MSNNSTEALERRVDRQVHAKNDAQLLQLWVHGKSPNTQEAYLRDVEQFLSFADVSLHYVRLQDLQDWADELIAKGYSESTRTRKIAALKSLFSFGHKIGYFTFNVGAAISGPKVRDDLAERILSAEDVKRILEMGDTPRNSALLRLFYASGARVSELASLRWKSLIKRRTTKSAAAGQVSLHGKGDRTRQVLLTSATWRVLSELRSIERSEGFGGKEDPVFRSQKGGTLSRQQIWNIVKGAARAAGCSDAVSPHWLRHAHASHALDEGAPVHLVKETLGHKSLATTSRYTHARPDDSSAKYLDI